MNLFYTIVLGLPVFSSLVSERLKDNKQKKVFHWFLIILCSLLVSFRKNVGVDLINYEKYYQSYFSGVGPSVQFNDLGYNLLNRVLANSGVPFSVFLFLISIFTLRSFYYFLENSNIKNEFVATILYFLIFDIYVYSLSAIRQSISIAFLLYGIVTIKEKKYLLSVILLILGSTIHWSLLAIIPILFFSHKFKKVHVYSLLIFIPVSIILYLILMRTTLLNRIAQINYNLTLYFLYDVKTTYTNKYLWIIYLLLSVAWIFVISYFDRLDNGIVKFSAKEFFKKIVILEIEDWLVFIFFVSKIWLSMNYNSALPRFQMYLYFLLPFAVAKEVSKMDFKGKIIVSTVMMFFLIISFNNDLIANSVYYGNAAFNF